MRKFFEVIPLREAPPCPPVVDTTTSRFRNKA